MSMNIHRSGWRNVDFGTVSSLTVTRWHRWCSGWMWRQFWCRLSESVSWRGVQLCICAYSVSGDSVLYNLANKAAVRSIFPKLSQVSFHHSRNIFMLRKLNTTLLLFWDFGPTFIVRCCSFSIAAHEYPPLSGLAIFKARRMSDSSSCTWPPCLAIVADMLKTYKKLVAAST